MSAGKEKSIICKDCGAVVVTQYSQTRYCRDCYKKRRIISMKTQQEQRRIERSENEPIHLCDSPEKIEMCLNCEREECVNCLSGYVPKGEAPRKERGVQLREVKDEVIAYFEAGKRNIEIAVIFDVRNHTVSQWKRRLKEEGLL